MEIFFYIYTKKNNNNINLYPDSINLISDKKKRNNKKKVFRRSCNSFIINKDNRLIQKIKYHNLFIGKLYNDNFLIII